MFFPNRAKIIRKGTELDPLGKAETLSEETYPCRIDEVSKIVKNNQGEEKVVTIQIAFSGRLLLGETDEISFEIDGIKYERKPVAFNRSRDGIGHSQLLVVDV